MRYEFAGYELDTERHVLRRGDVDLRIEPQVFDLLHLLVRNAGRLVTRDELVAEVWGGRIVSESAIGARIAAARRAVGDDGQRQAVIRTVARRGVQLVAEVVVQGAPPPRAVVTAPDDSGQRIRYALNPRGETIAYAVTGDGPPLARMSYTTTDLEAEWRLPHERAFFDQLGARFRLLRFDHVGFGQSQAPLTDISFDRMADDLACAADAAGFDRFALFAESGGTLEAVHFAARYPDRLSKLVIIGGYAEGRTRRDRDASPDAMRGLLAEGWHSPGSGMAMSFGMAYFPEGPLEVVQGMVGLMQESCPTEHMMLLRDAANAASILDLLPRVRCPVLIVHARHDAVHPLAQARKLAAGIPDAELLVLDMANHQPLPGHPVWDRFMQAFVGFLSD